MTNRSNEWPHSDRGLPTGRDVHIDKRNGAWLLTHWVDAETTLRIRIRHTGPLDPDEFVCELADAENDHEFRPLAHFLWHPEDGAHIYDWPLQWQCRFMALAEIWSTCLTLADWGLAPGDQPLTWNESPSPALVGSRC